ncbi:hypothetical protein [Nocardia sp. NBC_01329]|uniref:hypothetical protein n=1 Tax=Nocardia sp. NBC_01329 TaxID=2903594 RepID=UPI002E15D166|nr:hypothetical protein OG405_27605 [Nocardia sp. NBC_01329]
MGDIRRARRPSGVSAAIERIGAQLDEGSLRNELMVAALVLSSITVVMGLTADGFGWMAGYCLAGIVGFTGVFVVMRGDRPRQQWLVPLGIAVLEILLLIVYGRMSGSL